jgi:caa(3)-type oxidase subunit IV
MSDSHEPAKDSAPSAHDDHGHAAHDMHLGLYLGVGAFLIVATVITVALAYVDFGSHASNFIVAMIVATIKVCFVGAIFMHLKGEKKTIWHPLYFTAFFVLGLFLLTLLHWYDPIFSTVHNEH